jgi:spore maturation protein CgeB
MFEEGREADFFSSPEELVDKVRFYLLHDDTRRRVASAGRERCVKSRYSYAERMAEAMKAILRA